MAACLLSACSVTPKSMDIRKVAINNVDNFLTSTRTTDYEHFAGMSAVMTVRGRCLIVLTEMGPRTPIFMASGNFAIKNGGVYHENERLVSLGKLSQFSGHEYMDLPEDMKELVRGCPTQAMTVASIRDL